MLTAAASVAQAATIYYGLTFPERVADAQIGPTHDFETKDPGLGYSVRYQKPGWGIDIYIYDLGRSSIPSDLGSDALKAQIKQAQGDIFEQQQRGTYANVKVTRSYVIKDAAGRSRFLCEAFTYARQNVDVDSYLCLTGWNDKFIKFRLTAARSSRNAAEALRFMEAWLRVLWP